MKEATQYNWRKIFWVGVLVCVVAYAFGEPYLEKWLGIELPSIRDQGDLAIDHDPSDLRAAKKQAGKTDPKWNSSHSRADKGWPQSEHHDSAPASTDRSNSQTADSAENRAGSKPFLRPTGRKNRLQSPAGLIYGMGAGGQHRVEHVMSHASDNPSRPVHSVFDENEEEILKVIDEAYELIKSNSDRVRSKPDERLDFRVEHVVDMQRKIGYLGGQRGRRENYPPRSSLTLVLDNGKFVITAYPD